MTKKLKFPHYWICYKCARERGGKWPRNHCATVVYKVCEYCQGKNHKPNELIAPYVDYDWPGHDFSKERD